ncbi:unnamed protein product [Musa acuminata var. zebrina]
MDHRIVFLSIPLFVLLLLCLQTSAAGNLTSDMQALLKFAASVPHGRKLNWSSRTPVCSSWVGVTCTPDRTRVQSLRLPGVGLFGQIPADTLGELGALDTLSLRSNHLVGDLPADVPYIPSLRSLYLQHNNISGIIPSSSLQSHIPRPLLQLFHRRNSIDNSKSYSAYCIVSREQFSFWTHP